MRDTIEDILDKLQEGFYHNEEHVRVCIVLRILQHLEWEIWNPTEVNTEFKTVPNEDSSRVDIALFASPYSPSVFIEVKAVGKVESDLDRAEQQLRDYNRNNTAEFSIITDGQKWRFYYSQTGGEFRHKLFKQIDIAKDDIEDVVKWFHSFLGKSEIVNRNAQRDASHYLELSQRQKAMEDALPKAKRLSQEPPYPRLPDALLALVREAGIVPSEKEIDLFLNQERQSTIEPGPAADREVQGPRLASEPRPRLRNNRGASQLPPDGTKCRFKYAGKTYDGRIEHNQLVVESFGTFVALSRASSLITDTSRNGWRDWEFQLPGTTDWVLAQTWRERHGGAP